MNYWSLSSAVDIRPTVLGARSPSIANLTERAFAFLHGLKELGLIDDIMAEEVLNRLMYYSSDRVGIEEMKMTAALVIFEHQFDLSEEYFGIFEEEWKLLFN